MSGRPLSKVARGRVGERIARDYLWASGHEIIALNARVGRDELDIVSIAPEGTLVFTEVRAHAEPSGAFPRGLATLDRAKVGRWARAAAAFRRAHPAGPKRPCRLDAIAVTLASPCVVSHVRGVVPHAPSPSFLHRAEP